MAEAVFINLSLVLLLAVVVSTLMRLLKQPLIIGYIITGILVGPYFLNLFSENAAVGTFAQMGVALLLFTVGLHLNPKVIKEVGKVSLITGLGQVLFTSVIGFGLAQVLGFSPLTSIYIAIALTFSSTIIIMKLLSDKGDMESVYGKISIGFLIVQDLIAVIILMVVSSFSSGEDLASLFLQTFLYGALAILALFFVTLTLLGRLMKYVAKSQEYLFLFSISWCLALASLFTFLNFSLEIGALLAGMALSMTPYANEISSKMKTLRDFFIVLFFIVIGSQMVIGEVMENIVPIVVFSLFILIGNPLIVMILMGTMKYTKRTGFMAGLTVAQISEFSIILVSLGYSVGHVSSEVLSIVTVVGLITIAGSTYLITFAQPIYSRISPMLSIFERSGIRDKRNIKRVPSTILFGYNRIGYGILQSLKKIRKSYLVVDYNPETINDLSRLGVPVMYGDAYDADMLEDLPLDKTRMFISTIPEYDTNALLVKTIRAVNKKAVIIVRAHSIEHALELYRLGASYVLTPHFLGGEYISRMVSHKSMSPKSYDEERRKHIKHLRAIFSRGLDHPNVDKN